MYLCNRYSWNYKLFWNFFCIKNKKKMTCSWLKNELYSVKYNIFCETIFSCCFQLSQELHKMSKISKTWRAEKNRGQFWNQYRKPLWKSYIVFHEHIGHISLSSVLFPKLIECVTHSRKSNSSNHWTYIISSLCRVEFLENVKITGRINSVIHMWPVARKGTQCGKNRFYVFYTHRKIVFSPSNGVFKKKFEDLLISENHRKVRSKPDVSLLSTSREKPPLPLTHTSCLIVSMCVRGCRFLRADLALVCGGKWRASFSGSPDSTRGAWFQRPFHSA